MHNKRALYEGREDQKLAADNCVTSSSCLSGLSLFSVRSGLLANKSHITTSETVKITQQHKQVSLRAGCALLRVHGCLCLRQVCDMRITHCLVGSTLHSDELGIGTNSGFTLELYNQPSKEEALMAAAQFCVKSATCAR